MKIPLRYMLAAIAGIALTLIVNLIGVWWVRATEFEQDSFYDGSAALLTLVIPALLGGLLIGCIARGASLNLAGITFVLFCIAGFIHPFWRIPLVSPHSAHSGAMHYFLYNPIVALAFGALGGWLGGQFATGRFVLADRGPVPIQGLED